MAMTGVSRRLPLVSAATLRAEALAVDAAILRARGMTHQEIADELRVNVRTVERWLA